MSDCKEVCELLPTYADGELDAARARELERHLSSCASCAAQLSELRALKKAVITHPPYHRMPGDFRARLRASLPREVRERPPRRQPWLSLGAALAAGIALTLGTNVFFASRGVTDQLSDELVACHVRSLLADHLSDVASSDRHTVKPWFVGKLDFAPPVRDLAPDFPLIGGRLDYINGHNVAALIYKHRAHTINLFVWPAQSATNTDAQPMARKGYNLVHWTSDGMNWWAVSDADAATLASFAQTLRAPAPANS